MGYTNYWKQPDFTDTEWTLIKKEYDYIKEMCDGYVRDETIDEDEIIFNGVPDHETFVLYKSLKHMNKIYSCKDGFNENNRFNFCKTARKPYDIAVWHLLFYANSITNGKLEISRDR
tara:strand:+ start:276 stop:626 length:351 start_codon:yes stop_codon:yes gene_type:complete